MKKLKKAKKEQRQHDETAECKICQKGESGWIIERSTFT